MTSKSECGNWKKLSNIEDPVKTIIRAAKLNSLSIIIWNKAVREIKLNSCEESVECYFKLRILCVKNNL